MHYVYIIESLTVRVRSLVPRELQRGTARYLQPAAGLIEPKDKMHPVSRDRGALTLTTQQNKVMISPFSPLYFSIL
jgi:hypothetical protein